MAGAGVAGLTTVSLLHAAGIDVVCLEARTRVGGRTLSAGWVDLGATWFWDGEAAMAETVASLGLGSYRQFTGGDALFEQPDGTSVRLAGNPLDVPAFRLTAGMQSVALELTRRLPEGVVRLGAPVESVTFHDHASVQVVAGALTLTARLVVLAVPPKVVLESVVFSPALPPGLVQVASTVHTWMSDTVKAVARFDEPFWRDAGLAGAAVSHAGPFREFHDHSGPAGQAAIFGFAPAAGPHGAGQGSGMAGQFVDQLERMWGPEAGRPSDVQLIDWSQEEFTAAPGSGRSPVSSGYGHPMLRSLHMDRRLAFASTETAHAFAGHVEGAVIAGRRAAGQALELLRRGGGSTGS